MEVKKHTACLEKDGFPPLTDWLTLIWIIAGNGNYRALH